VLMKLKEQEEKKNKVKKLRSKNTGDTTLMSKNIKTKKKQKKTPLNGNEKNKENRTTKDPELDAGIQILQNAINYTQDIEMSDYSDDECSSFLY